MLTRRVYPDERAIPVRTNMNGYSVQQWHNPDEGVVLIMATFPVSHKRVSANGRKAYEYRIAPEGEAAIFNMMTGKPEMTRVGLGQFYDSRSPQDILPLPEGPHPVDLWERPLWLVYLVWLTAIGAAGLALVLLVVWLRLRS